MIQKSVRLDFAWYNGLQLKQHLSKVSRVNESVPFCEWLKKRRKALDFTLHGLAQELACSPNTLRKYESGERRPSKQLAERLAYLLKVEAEELPHFINYARIGSIETPIASLVPPPLKTVQKLFTNARPLTQLIGRAELVNEVQDLLIHEQKRLVSLCGPGGVGKTRLAQELLYQLRDGFADGALFVGLSELREPIAALTHIAQQLGLEVEQSESVELQLCTALASRHILLVLDNLEQIESFGASLLPILNQCPEVWIITTSRAPLLLQSEQVVLVPPLALPDESAPLQFELFSQIATIALFVERARRVNARFALTKRNANVIAAICRRLDGLPLAIELAANRLRVLSPVQLLNELERSLSLLASSAADLPPRHRTMRSTIAWSCDLLEPEAQQLFMSLAVFTGGATLDMIKAICAEQDQDDSIELLDQLQFLTEQNLVRASDDDEELRFSMLTVIQEYASELLAASGYERELRMRHAQWCLDFASHAVGMIEHADQQIWIHRLKVEHVNFQSALDWLLCPDGDLLEIGAKLVWHLQRFWYTCGYLAEGMHWMQLYLREADRLPENLLADLLYRAAVVANEYRQSAQAEVWAEQSLALARSQDRPAAIAAALPILSSIRQQRGELVAAEELAAESVAIFRELGDRAGLSDALDRLAQCAYFQGDLARAISLHEEVVALRRGLDNRWLIAASLNNLGFAIHEQGDSERALPFLREATALVDALGNNLMHARMQVNLGSVHFKLGNKPAAATSFRQGLRIIWKHNDVFTLAWLLREVASLIVDENPIQAVRFMSKAEFLSKLHQTEVPLFDQDRFQATIDRARSSLSQDIFLLMWHGGEQQELADLVAQAIEICDQIIELA